MCELLASLSLSLNAAGQSSGAAPQSATAVPQSSTAGAQSAELPSAPAPAKTLLPTLPPGMSRTVIASSGPPPLAPEGEEFCYAPAEGEYSPQPKLSKEAQADQDHYWFMQSDSLRRAWWKHMPVSATAIWTKDSVVIVRFAILPDGSINSPVITLSSGHAVYDKHAIDTILRAAPFDPLPGAMNRPMPVCMCFGFGVKPPRKKFKPDDLLKPPAKPAQ
jgi:TonB family protein